MFESSGIHLTDSQKQFVYSPYLVNYLFGQSLSGKTFAGCHFLLEQAITYPKRLGTLIADNRDTLETSRRSLCDLADRIGLQVIYNMRPPDFWPHYFSFTNWRNLFILSNGATIMCCTLSTDCRGLDFAYVFADLLNFSSLVKLSLDRVKTPPGKVRIAVLIDHAGVQVATTESNVHLLQDRIRAVQQQRVLLDPAFQLPPAQHPVIRPSCGYLELD